jgi:hypothetical protein
MSTKQNSNKSSTSAEFSTNSLLPNSTQSNNYLSLQSSSPQLKSRFRHDILLNSTDMQTKTYQPKQKQSQAELKINLQNLYINPKTYNPQYNFYNYSRFKQTQIIPIIYKTPSIFLNGLHFELPIANIIGITKPADTQIIKLNIQISKQDFQSVVSFDDILGVFQKIEEYNSDFFEINSSKMDIKIRKTLKNLGNFNSISPHQTQKLEPILDETSANRFKNPGSKRLEYRPFYELDGDNIIMLLEIKQPYLLKIIQSQYLTLTSRHITVQGEITESLRQYIQQIESLCETLNLEFFDLKKRKIDINLALRPISIHLWIKCNMFSLDTGQNKISMQWKVCNYKC